MMRWTLMMSIHCYLLLVPVLLLAVSFLGPDDEEELRLRRPLDEIIIDGRSKVKVMR